jgi:hypothetical protein
MKRPLLVSAVVGVVLVLASFPRIGAEARTRVAADSLASPAGPGSAEPNLTVGADGRVYLSWHEPGTRAGGDSGFALRMAVLDGRTWSEPRTIRTGRDFFVNWADFPSVAVLGKGRLAAHWLQKTGTTTYAYGVRIAFSNDDGRTWSAPIIPHSDSSNNEHGFVSLWLEGRNLSATWLDGRKFDRQPRNPRNEMTLMTGMLDATGAPGRDALLDPRVCDCCQTSAAMTVNGPIVAYRDRSPEEIRDISYVRRVRGKWTNPAPIHDDGWQINACPVNGPAVDAIGERVALAWFTAANNQPKVNLAFSSSAGLEFSDPIRIDEGNPAGRVDVAVLRDGGALVTWIERTGGDTAAVRLRRVDRRGRPGRPITIAASSAVRASGFPRMAIAGDQVIFAWTAPTRPTSVRVARMRLESIR